MGIAGWGCRLESWPWCCRVEHAPECGTHAHVITHALSAGERCPRHAATYAATQRRRYLPQSRHLHTAWLACTCAASNSGCCGLNRKPRRYSRSASWVRPRFMSVSPRCSRKSGLRLRVATSHGSSTTRHVSSAAARRHPQSPIADTATHLSSAMACWYNSTARCHCLRLFSVSARYMRAWGSAGSSCSAASRHATARSMSPSSLATQAAFTHAGRNRGSVSTTCTWRWNGGWGARGQRCQVLC